MDSETYASTSTNSTTAGDTDLLQGNHIAIISSAVISAVVLVIIGAVIAIGAWLHRRLRRLEQEQQYRHHNGAVLEMRAPSSESYTKDFRFTEMRDGSSCKEPKVASMNETTQEDAITQGKLEEDLQDDVALRSHKGLRHGGNSFTAYFGHSRTSIFGDVDDFSVLFPLCQDYFSQNDNRASKLQEGQVADHTGGFEDIAEEPVAPVTEIPIEAIVIEQERGEIKRTYDNHSFENDEGAPLPKLQRPMSMNYALKLDDPDLEASLSEDPSTKSFMASFDHRQGMYARKSIGPQGGEITLQEVKLTIPPYALEETKDISVGIIWDKSHMPNLTRKQALLSPVVVCEPHGIRFAKPVTLSIPHCAVDVRTSWNIQPMMSQTSVFQGVQWMPMTIADYDSRLIQERKVSIELRHFTLYSVIGASTENAIAAKSVRLVAFASSLQVGMMFKIRVYCVNNYKDEFVDVQRNERDLNAKGTLLDAPAPIIVHDNGQDVFLEIQKVSSGWAVISDATQKFPFECMWHSLSPCCTFVLKPNAEQVFDVLCEILSYQKGNEKLKQKITIAEEVKSLEAADIITTSLGAYSVFPYPLRTRIIIALDTHNTFGRDWHMVAEKMGIESGTMAWLESRTSMSTSSPTEQLLRMWESQRKTLGEFYRLMIQLDRLDVASEIERYLDIKERASENSIGPYENSSD